MSLVEPIGVALLKTDGQANLVKKEALSALTEEATALLSVSTKPPFCDAAGHWLRKTKELLSNWRLTPEALATAKTGLETNGTTSKINIILWSHRLVEVQFSNLEPTAIKGLKVAKVEANQAEKES